MVSRSHGGRLTRVLLSCCPSTILTLASSTSSATFLVICSTLNLYCLRVLNELCSLAKAYTRVVTMHATTSSQDYDSFELNDPELLQVLADAESSHTLKRARSESPEPMELDEKRPPTHPYAGGQAYLDSETYGASRFGGIGDFMRRKRAKLQIQNAQISQSKENAGEEEERSKLFKGLAIYVRTCISCCLWDGL